MYKLSIIITYHNEDEKLLHPLLSCLDTQQGVNWNEIEILFSNNCDNPKNIKEFLKQYTNIYNHINCIYPLVKNLIGMSRQYAIDQSSGKYLFFCDCDDTLGTCTILVDILNAISSNADIYDMIEFEETNNAGTKKFSCLQFNPIYVHGKVYKTSFLRENNIRFHEKLNTYEDNYFCFIADGCNPRREPINTLGYVWKNNPNSVSRRNGGTYAEDNWEDAFMRIFYIFRYMNKYQPVREGDIWNSLYNCFGGWYQTLNLKYKFLPKFKNQFKNMENLLGFIYYQIDPNLDYVEKASALIPHQNPLETYSQWIYKITHQFDDELIREKYKIDDR